MSLKWLRSLARPGSAAGASPLRFAAAAACALLAGAAALTTPVERAERLTHDWRFHTRPRRETGARVVLATITDETLEAWPEPTLFWGPRYAAAIRQARRLGVTWIGLDFIHAVSADEYLRTHTRDDLLPDRAFALALREGRTVLSYAGRTRPTPALIHAHPGQPEDVGFVQRWPELDNAVRHAPIYSVEEGELYPSFVAVLAARARGEEPADPAALRRAARWGTADAGGAAAWINYAGPPGTFPPISIERLAAGRLDAVERERLRGAVLLIGPDYDGSNDRHMGVAGRNYAGVEINAHALAMLLDGRPLRRGAPALEAGAVLLASLAASLLAACLPPAWGLLAAAALTLAWAGSAAWAFRSDLLLPVAGPAAGIWTAWAGQLWVHWREEAERRRRVEAVFGPHVGRSVMRRLLESEDAERLGGQRREITVLFSDIRDFTAVSERLSPEAVVRQVNEYFGQMTRCVFAHEGTLDKYVGDGVMAFWNSPDDQADHAPRAVAAAWAMLRSLEELNGFWRAEGRPELQIGIGVNTGEALVGNLGSEERRMYTIMGSAVNLASRIEAANKELGTRLLIGESTYGIVRERGRFRSHRVKVRGLDTPVTLYEVLAYDDRPGGPEAGGAKEQQGCSQP